MKREDSRQRARDRGQKKDFLTSAAAALSNIGPNLRQRSYRKADARKTFGAPRRTAVEKLAWAYVAAIIAVAALMWGFGDVWWPGTVLLFMGRWVFLLPFVVLIPLSLFFDRSALLPIVAGLLVALGPLMGGRIGWRAWLPANGPTVRVVTYNANGGDRTSFDLEFLLKAWNADIVAFQECSELLRAAVGATKGWHTHTVRNLCLLSRLPIREASVMDRSTLERVSEDRIAVGGAGDVVRYSLQSPSGMIAFTNLHLETPRKGFDGLLSGAGVGGLAQLDVNTALRDHEANLARRHVNDSQFPILVAGDFNTPVESRIFHRHWSSLNNAFSRAGLGFGTTKYNGWIRIRIDHVLTDDSWKVVSVKTAFDAGSDHRPLIVDLVRVKR